MWPSPLPIRRHNTTTESFSKNRAGKSTSFKKPKSFRHASSSRKYDAAVEQLANQQRTPQQQPQVSP
jgi:hypothetical protein